MSRLLKAFLLLAVSSCYAIEDSFSGFYEPNGSDGTSEDFAAAFLVSRARFLDCENSIKGASNMAGVSFAVARNRCKNCHTLLTRDYFDFLVEHLSSTTNQLPNPKLFKPMSKKLKRTSHNLQALVGLGPSSDPRLSDQRLNQTLGVLVYSSNAFSAKANELQSRIRKHFFEATFWSIFRFIPHIVVFVANQKDREEVQALSLPFWEIRQVEVPLDDKNRTVLLPRTSLVTVLNEFHRSDKTALTMSTPDPWRNFQYVYFTEGDQIVHWRSVHRIYDVIDDSGGRFAVVPHRMQTLPVAQGFQMSNLRNLYPPTHYLNLPNTTVLELDLGETQGSCCDDGKYIFTPCGGWWYSCNKWGVRDINPWIKFGRYGYTMLPLTAHRGTCKYSPEKKICPQSPTCPSRTPTKDQLGNFASKKDLCECLEKRVVLGPKDIKPANV